MQQLFENSMFSLEFEPVDNNYLVDIGLSEEYMDSGMWRDIPRTDNWDEEDCEIYEDVNGFIFT